MDKITKRYRELELNEVSKIETEYKPQIKITNMGTETKWLSVSFSELEKIKKVLTGEL